MHLISEIQSFLGEAFYMKSDVAEVRRQVNNIPKLLVRETPASEEIVYCKQLLRLYKSLIGSQKPSMVHAPQKFVRNLRFLEHSTRKIQFFGYFLGVHEMGISEL